MLRIAVQANGKGDQVLLIDDFLANGKALEGLAALVRDSGAELVGAGIVIEKGFQVGGDLIRSEGIRLESLAIVDSMDEETGTKGVLLKDWGAVRMISSICGVMMG